MLQVSIVVVTMVVSVTVDVLVVELVEVMSVIVVRVAITNDMVVGVVTVVSVVVGEIVTVWVSDIVCVVSMHVQTLAAKASPIPIKELTADGIELDVLELASCVVLDVLEDEDIVVEASVMVEEETVDVVVGTSNIVPLFLIAGIVMVSVTVACNRSCFSSRSACDRNGVGRCDSCDGCRGFCCSFIGSGHRRFYRILRGTISLHIAIP